MKYLNIIVFTLLIIVISQTNMLSQELNSLCDKYIEKVIQNDEVLFKTKEPIKISCLYKKKKHTLNFNLLQSNEYLSIHLRFNKDICINPDHKLKITFVDNDTLIIKSKNLEENCEGVVFYTISSQNDREIINKIIDKEIQSMSIYIKNEKINLELSEFEIASIKFTIFCLNQAFETGY